MQRLYRFAHILFTPKHVTPSRMLFCALRFEAPPLSTNGQRIRPRMKTLDKRIARCQTLRSLTRFALRFEEEVGAAAACPVTATAHRLPLLRPYIRTRRTPHAARLAPVNEWATNKTTNEDT